MSKINHIVINKKRDCCGCSACSSICPVSAIEMKHDDEGFLYPEIKSECINCGLCIKICNFKSAKKIDGTYNTKCFAVKHKDEIVRMSSSSGGVFTLLSDFFLEHGYAVACSIYDYNKHILEYRLITSKDERDKARGSKYVQSNPGDIFKQCYEWLLNNESKKLLFIGTGCHSGGFLSYVNKKKIRERVFIVDLICHGVTSPLLLEDFIKKKEKELCGSLNHMTFKDKRNGWTNPTAYVKIDEKEVLLDKFADLFYDSNCCLRPSCHICPYTTIKRNIDVTIGDYWGIENVNKDFFSNQGVSLVLVHNEESLNVLAPLLHNTDFIETGEDKCMQPRLIKPSRKSLRRKFFWRDYHKKGLSYVFLKYSQPFYGDLLIDKVSFFIYKVFKKIKQILKY